MQQVICNLNTLVICFCKYSLKLHASVSLKKLSMKLNRGTQGIRCKYDNNDTFASTLVRRSCSPVASDSLQQRTCCLAVRCNNNWWKVLGVSELYVKKFYHHHKAMDIIVHSTAVQLSSSVQIY